VKVEQKNVSLIIGLSIFACAAYTVMLSSSWNFYFWTSSAKLGLFLLVPLLYFGISKQGRFRDLFSFRGDKRWLKISTGIGAIAFLFIIIGFLVARGLFDRQMILDGLAKEGITKSLYPFVFLNIVLVNAFLEELFFRGFIFRNIFNLGFKRFAYMFSSLLFSLYHIMMMNSWFSPGIFLLLLVGLIGVGLLFSELCRRCGNILGGFFPHLGANLAINLVGVYLLYF